MLVPVPSSNVASTRCGSSGPYVPKTRSSATVPEIFIPVVRDISRRTPFRLAFEAVTVSRPPSNCTEVRLAAAATGAAGVGVPVCANAKSVAANERRRVSSTGRTVEALSIVLMVDSDAVNLLSETFRARRKVALRGSVFAVVYWWVVEVRKMMSLLREGKSGQRGRGMGLRSLHEVGSMASRRLRQRGSPVACGAIGLALALFLAAGPLAWSETCTTQSAMQPADRDALSTAAREIIAKMQANDASALQSQTVAEFASNFSGIRQGVQELAPHLHGDTLALDEIFLLDATGLAAGGDAQFFCTLNRSQAEVNFSIAGLGSGVYGFAIVQATGSSPWRISLLLRRDAGRWLLAGFFPGPTTAAGHDGLWYWREARRLAAAKQMWSSWLLYGEARSLLLPADFVQTSHLERLDDERKAAAPPVLSAGISPTTPLVVKASDGKEYRFTGLSTEEFLGRDKIDALVHVQGTPGDAAALSQQSDGAAHALLAAYPELRATLGGVIVSLEVAGTTPLITERPMAELR